MYGIKNQGGTIGYFLETKKWLNTLSSLLRGFKLTRKDKRSNVLQNKLNDQFINPRKQTATI